MPNPQLAAENANRKARHAGAAGRLTADDITARWRAHGGRCYLCGCEADTIDHVIPLADSEGRQTNTPANVRPACRACNTRKAAIPISVLIPWIGAGFLDHKPCPSCGDLLPLEGFTTRRDRRTLRGWCRSCNTAQSRRWRQRRRHEAAHAAGQLQLEGAAVNG